MTAKKATRLKSANATAGIYDGQFEVFFDCAGPRACAHAGYHLSPPDPDDDCAWHQNGTCLSYRARRTALELMRDGLVAELEGEDAAN